MFCRRPGYTKLMKNMQNVSIYLKKRIMDLGVYTAHNSTSVLLHADFRLPCCWALFHGTEVLLRCYPGCIGVAGHFRVLSEDTGLPLIAFSLTKKDDKQRGYTE